MSRILALIIGYFFGIIQAGYIYGRLHHIDIRYYGSGNAGTTNVMRTLGKKAGFITYFVDMLKAVAAAVVVHLLLGRFHRDIEALLFCYSGLGVVLGHNYPFYLGFKGGKGIAASSGVILSFVPYNFIMAIAGFCTFMITMFTTKYVSLASLSMMLAFFFEFVIFGCLGDYNMGTGNLLEAYIIVFIITLLAFVRHRENIKRLAAGNERKIGQKKS